MSRPAQPKPANLLDLPDSGPIANNSAHVVRIIQRIRIKSRGLNNGSGRKDRIAIHRDVVARHDAAWITGNVIARRLDYGVEEVPFDHYTGVVLRGYTIAGDVQVV